MSVEIVDCSIKDLLENPYNKLNRKKRIIEAASTAFLNNGYAGATLSDIARAAGIQKSSIFHHFESKETIACSILQTTHDFYEQVVFTKTLSSFVNHEGLARLFLALLAETLVSKENPLLLFFILKTAGHQSINTTIDAHIKRWMDVIRVILFPLHGRDKTELIAEQSLCMIAGYLLLKKAHTHLELSAQTLKQSLESLWLSDIKHA